MNGIVFEWRIWEILYRYTPKFNAVNPTAWIIFAVIIYSVDICMSVTVGIFIFSRQQMPLGLNLTVMSLMKCVTFLWCLFVVLIFQNRSYLTYIENPAGAQRNEEGAMYFLNDIKCEGFESRLSTCKHSAIGQYPCRSSHYRAKVTCARPAYPREYKLFLYLVFLNVVNTMGEGGIQSG